MAGSNYARWEPAMSFTKRVDKHILFRTTKGRKIGKRTGGKNEEGNETEVIRTIP